MEHSEQLTDLPHFEDLERKFTSKLKNFSAFAADHGLEIKPDSNRTWPQFRSLSGPMQQDCYNRFSSYNDLCIAAAASGIAFNDNQSLVWWAVQKFELRPCSDFFDKLKKDHIVEIYNRDFVQIYRNWAFFQISSYSMGDLFVFPWPDLYARDAEVTQHLISYASQVLGGSVHTTMATPSPRHIVVEALSPGRNILDMELKFASPLYDSKGAVAAFFAVSSVTKIGRMELDETQKFAPILTLADRL